MARESQDRLVSTEWLAGHLDDPGVVVIDASYYLPMEQKQARKDYEAEHIPGAVFFDIDEIGDPDSELPHMLPSTAHFDELIGALGIHNDDQLVVYDRRGMMSAPRVWWTFKAMGHGPVAVLDGGLEKWRSEGRPLEGGKVEREPHRYTARLDARLVRDINAMRTNLDSGREQVIDARAADRFAGEAPELWPGRRQGHIPGSLNLPWNDLVDSASGTFKPLAEIRNKFAKAGVDPERPVVTTCGSGITAAVLSFGLHLAGHKKTALYDASWSEWGLPGDTPVETGPPDKSPKKAK
ncbi:MAG: 3-mercaptopyruvate sulfurtransferase [Rhodovibrionaceae bacterium]